FLFSLALVGRYEVLIQPEGDLCHVYVVDVTRAKRALRKYKSEDKIDYNDKELEAGTTDFPAFETEVSEEVATTKHYRIPKTNVFISATVYYTDESMESKINDSESTSESMILGIVVGGRKVANAIALEANNAVAEAPYLDAIGKVRVKQYVTVNKRKYLV